MNCNFLDQLKSAHKQGIFSAFIRDTAESGTLFEAIPQLSGLDEVQQDPRWHPEGDVWTHTLLVIENLPSNATFAMILAALLHDIGKASTTVLLESGAISAHGHEGVSEQMTHEILGNLEADEQLRKEVAFLVRNHMTAHNKHANAKTLWRLVREGGRELVDQLLQHGVADVAGGCRDFTDCDRLRNVFNQIGEVIEKPRAVLTGEEIIALTGLKPGPEIGHILRALTALDNLDKATAVDFVINWRKSS